MDTLAERRIHKLFTPESPHECERGSCGERNGVHVRCIGSGMLREPFRPLACRPSLELEVLITELVPCIPSSELQSDTSVSLTRSWMASPRERPFKNMNATVPTTVQINSVNTESCENWRISGIGLVLTRDEVER